ncbi:ABC transporter permease subunit [Labrys monachus]|uniref:Taurine transport system permease protein n=1 Tax=Labrys monachus TaxID=217067 RepID=A0ABU0FIP6_9HYPH|nr:ABC transporter permease subunit [Labrys monachus]MDQ0394351.1 taurine transport system permease protein [Labrys monachus]
MSEVIDTGSLTDLAAGKDRPAARPSSLTAGPVRALTILAILFLWWLATRLELVEPLFLPSPRAVLDQLFLVSTEGYADSTLWQHLGASLWRIFAALLIALATAVPAGFAIGLSPIARGILDPIIEFLRPIPPLAYLPLMVIWCGIGETTKVLIILIAIFAPVAITTAAGVATVPADRLDAARALGARKWQVLLHVILPNALPSILTGVRIGLGVGWSTLVAAELVAATRGLGFMIQTASQFLLTDVVLLGILVIALVAIALEGIVRLVERLLVPWHGKA